MMHALVANGDFRFYHATDLLKLLVDIVYLLNNLHNSGHRSHMSYGQRMQWYFKMSDDLSK